MGLQEDHDPLALGIGPHPIQSRGHPQGSRLHALPGQEFVAKGPDIGRAHPDRQVHSLPALGEAVLQALQVMEIAGGIQAGEGEIRLPHPR